MREFIVDHYKGFKGTIENRALPSLQGGSLEITLTVPFRKRFFSIFSVNIPNKKMFFRP